MAKCNNCGSFVSDRFARVFGSNEDEVYACRSCVPDKMSNRMAFSEGYAADPTKGEWRQGA